MSSLGSHSGSEESGDPFEIDVEEALREFGAPAAGSAATPEEEAVIDTVGGEANWSGSDPDVIHIDLTQRPPPLPMSGLPLQQIVSMLPGTTYAVSGSGVPIRTSPRSEPQQQLPSAKTSPKPAAASADSGHGAEQVKEDVSAAATNQAAAVQESSGHGAGGGPSSPHVALTFIPGLGLVPVMIHDVLEEDEDELTDVCDGGAEQAAGVEARAAAGASTESGGQAAFEPADTGSTSKDAGLSSSPEARLAEPAGAGIRTATVPSVAHGQSKRLDVSEGQLEDIIQQAIMGLHVQEWLQDPDDAPEGSLFSSDPDSDIQAPAMFGRLISTYGRPVGVASDGDKAASTVGSSTQQLLGTYERTEHMSRPAAALQLPGEFPVTRGGDGAADDELDEYDDNLVDDGVNDSLDEVDDSGSGGGDEPDSILGGLAHARLGLAADGVHLGNPAMRNAINGGYASTTVEVSGIHHNEAHDKAPASTAADKADVDAHFTVRVSECSTGAGLHLPRPRYLSQNFPEAYDTSYGTSDCDSPFGGGNGAARGFERSGAGGVAFSASDAIKHANSDGGSSPRTATTVITRGGSGVSSSRSGGSDLNSTFRGTGQSLAAIRQAALQAEAQRQAKSMAERLGGGGDNGSKAALNDRLRHFGSRPVAASISNPFGNAGHEASAAAGHTKADAGGGSSSSRTHSVTRGGAGGLSSGNNEHASGQQRHPAGDGVMDANDDHVDGYVLFYSDSDEEVEGVDVEAGLEDLLRDRSIIQPRYPADPKRHQYHHGRREGVGNSEQHHRDELAQGIGAGGSDLSMTMESDGSGGWRPRHRRSVDVVDLEKLAQGEAESLDKTCSSGSSSSRSFDGGSSLSPPTSRSLVAARKSDDGQLAPPLPSSSPRMRGDGSGSDSSGGSSALSSSAHSVAEERLVDELEALREELGQKTTLVAGLRGELRKYTDLAMRLEHQLRQLRSQAGDAVPSAKASARAHSDTGGAPSSAGAATPVAMALPGGRFSGTGEQHAREQQDGLPAASTPADETAPGAGPASGLQPKDAAPPAAAAGRGQGHGLAEGVAPHTLPPHPQAQGLEGPSRLTLYREILSQAQLQVGRSGGPAPPDLRDAQELLRGKEILDAGTEKVMLIKLQKMLTWGVEAGWKASVAAQQAKFMEHATQQEAQARAAWEAEREQLRQALEEARAAAALSLGKDSSAGGCMSEGSSSAGSAGPYVAESELRRQLQASQDDAAAARSLTADLESAVASLNADVRKLRGQLRSSRDGTAERRTSDSGVTPSARFEVGGVGSSTGAEAVDAGTANRADSKAWALERKLLLTTITSIKDELEQARSDAAARAAMASDGALPGGRRDDEAFARKVALADAALGRVEKLEAEREAALEEVARLELKLDEALRVADLMEKERIANAETIQELREQLLESEVERQGLKAAFSKEVGEKCGLEEKLRQAREALASALRAAEQTHEAMEQQAMAAVEEQVASERDAAAVSLDVEEAFRAKAVECERLQQLVEIRSRELALAESELQEVRAAVSELQKQASETQAQVEELQALLEAVQGEREVMLVDLVAARFEAAAAKERAGDTNAVSLMVEAALARPVEETEALHGRVAGLEEELEGAREGEGLWRARAGEAEKAMAEARVELTELRASVAGLETEARDLRTALSAEDCLQAQLRGQVECLESELEAQASLAQSRGEEAARMEVALADVEHHRHGTAAAASEAAIAAASELRDAHSAAAAAEARALELEVRIVELQVQLSESMRRCAQAEAYARSSDIKQQLHAEALGQRVVNEPQATDAERLAEHAAGDEPQPQPEAMEVGEAVGVGSASPQGFAALEERLRAVEAERDQAREEAAALRRELEEAPTRSTTMMSPYAHDSASQQPDYGSGDGGQAAGEQEQQLPAALLAERDQLQSDCVALQAGLEQARSAGEAARREAEALRQQLQAARSELQTVSVELSVKAELMAAKDRSLATLQETVDALKVALQITQRNMQPTAPSPRRSPARPEGDESADRDLLSYRCSVAALQNKFADSESTIRRLEQQVAALETRLSSDDGVLMATPRSNEALGQDPEGRRSQLQSPELHTTATAALEMQLKEKSAENVHLLQQLEGMKGPAIATAADDLGHADSSPPPHGLAGNGGCSVADLVASAATISSLQMQLTQWQAISEDLHARYQAKKDTVRRLREQLAKEQQRWVDEQAKGQAQLQTASQRLGRLVTELGATLRRCIALDLQPLSATALTTSSPQVLMAGGDVLPDDINKLAALLARQGAALVESLEAALDQVNIAREERALVTAQLANRQAVLDELRHHLARQAVTVTAAPPGKTEAAAAIAAAANGVAGSGSPRISRVSPATSSTDVLLQAAPTSTASVCGTPTPTVGSTHSPGASLAAAAADTTPHAAPISSTSPSPSPSPSPSTRALHAAALNLAQDMAALSAQQAGLRSTLQGIEQRTGPRPRSMSSSAAASAGYVPTVLGGSSGFPLHSMVSYPAVSPLRARNIAAAPDSFRAVTASIPSGSPPHAYVGILSAGGRLAPRAHALGGAVSAGGSLHSGVRHAPFGLYGHPATSPSPERTRALELMGRDLAALRSTPHIQPVGANLNPGGGGGGSSGSGSLLGAGSLGMSANTGPGLGAGLALSGERRLKLAESGL